MRFERMMWKDHSDKELVDLCEIYQLNVARTSSGFLTNREEVERELSIFETDYFGRTTSKKAKKVLTFPKT